MAIECDCGLDLCGLEQISVVGCHEHSDEALVSVRGRKLASLAKQLLACQMSSSMSASKSDSILIEDVKNWCIST
jgi:hypothetical protein